MGKDAESAKIGLRALRSLSRQYPQKVREAISQNNPFLGTVATYFKSTEVAEVESFCFTIIAVISRSQKSTSFADNAFVTKLFDMLGLVEDNEDAMSLIEVLARLLVLDESGLGAHIV